MMKYLILNSVLFLALNLFNNIFYAFCEKELFVNYTCQNLIKSNSIQFILLDSVLVLSNNLNNKSDTIKFRYIKKADGFKQDKIRKKIVIWQKNTSIFESYNIENKKVVDIFLLNRSDISDMNYHERYGFMFIIYDSIGNNNLLKIYPNLNKGDDINEIYKKKEKKISCYKYSQFYSFEKKTFLLSNNIDTTRFLKVIPFKGKYGTTIECFVK